MTDGRRLSLAGLGRRYSTRWEPKKTNPFIYVDGLAIDLNATPTNIGFIGAQVQDWFDDYFIDAPHDFRQGVGINRPKHDANNPDFLNRPSVTFESAVDPDYMTEDDSLDLAAGDHLMGFLVIYIPSTAAGVDRFLDKRGTGITGSTPGWFTFMNAVENYSFQVDNGAGEANTAVATNGPINDDSRHLLEWYYDDDLGLLETMIDGDTTNKGSVTNASLSGTDKSNAQDLTLCRATNGFSHPADCDISRMLVYHRSTSPFISTERNLVRKHLARIYNITLIG